MANKVTAGKIAAEKAEAAKVEAERMKGVMERLDAALDKISVPMDEYGLWEGELSDEGVKEVKKTRETTLGEEILIREMSEEDEPVPFDAVTQKKDQKKLKNDGIENCAGSSNPNWRAKHLNVKTEGSGKSKEKAAKMLDPVPDATVPKTSVSRKRKKGGKKGKKAGIADAKRQVRQKAE